MTDEDIKKEAKEIMDNFMKAMKDIEVEEDYNLIREKCYRDEEEGVESDEDFRQRFLSNASKVSGEYVLANKGDWEK